MASATPFLMKKRSLGCTRDDKYVYPTLRSARIELKRRQIMRLQGRELEPYYCPVHRGYHLGGKA